MLDSSFLDIWVPIFIPLHLGPDSNPAHGKPLLGVYIVSSEDMDKSKKIWYEDSEHATLNGQIVDIGELLSLVNKESYNKLKGRFIIRINDCLSEEQAIYALAHEAGHLVGFVENPEEHEKDPDIFADNYAIKKITDVMGDDLLKYQVLLYGLTTAATRA